MRSCETAAATTAKKATTAGRAPAADSQRSLNKVESHEINVVCRFVNSTRPFMFDTRVCAHARSHASLQLAVDCSGSSRTATTSSWVAATGRRRLAEATTSAGNPLNALGSARLDPHRQPPSTFGCSPTRLVATICGGGSSAAMAADDDEMASCILWPQKRAFTKDECRS